MWVVCRLSVFREPFTDRAFGFHYIPFFTFFTFDHISKVSRITGHMLFYYAECPQGRPCLDLGRVSFLCGMP